MNNTSTISSITPQTAKKILADNGMFVSEEIAADVLQFLTTLATTIIRNEKLLPVHTSKH
jgi:hypothetical protein